MCICSRKQRNEGYAIAAPYSEIYLMDIEQHVRFIQIVVLGRQYFLINDIKENT